ncbi:hypothetical protein [Nocardioides sp. Leaf285]|uniref:hypothetical protein n=1 Tax=Nocardioides sp. Leaf285 TaxID=1736322 RepID=UPI000703AE80|nr:hypothetical protein [Nocardioides sp. Leaf285]KQP62980.1 hypothetical protein ASF47_18380 [Nocardioides sp. Leaf285]
MTKTTYDKGQDPRNMTRSTLVRHLRAHVSGTKESTTLRRRVFDDTTEGWKVNWTNSAYAETYVEWKNGTLAAQRSRPVSERTALRDAALDEIEAALKGLGYVTKRETNVVLVLRRMGA